MNVNLPTTSSYLWNESAESLCQSKIDRPRLAKNVAYAEAILNVWKKELLPMIDAKKQMHEYDLVVDSPIEYSCKEDDGTKTILYGHMYSPGTTKNKTNNEQSVPQFPGVVLFHTGAGPHDIYLHWKAHTLSRKMKYTVLIADIISDDIGWSWDDDRTKYSSVRNKLLEISRDGKRNQLRKRIRAALSTLKHLPNVNTDQVGAIGWCFGGQIALELVKMQSNVDGLKALATFHGVFDGVSSMLEATKTTTEESEETKIDNLQLPRVLVCNGEHDPFVPNQDRILFQKALMSYDWQWIDFKNCLHGFSNPAQATNPSPSFAYDEDAAEKSWSSVCAFLHETFESEQTSFNNSRKDIV